jgi:hypothetical protein
MIENRLKARNWYWYTGTVAKMEFKTGFKGKKKRF